MMRSLAAMTVLFAFACEDPAPAGGPATPPKPDLRPPASAAVTVVIAYGSEKKTWLEEQIAAFKQGNPTTKSGRPINVDARPMGSGDAARAILDGSLKPHVFSPASSAYIALLNQQWLSQAGHTKAVAPAGEPVVLSPIVIAMWKPMAEALGWPKKQLGWADLLRVNADKRGWGAYQHPEWGAFKLGHTHPMFSNSGLQAIVAVAYAGAKKQRGLTKADLDDKKVKKLLGEVEDTIVHYGKSTGFFADTLVDRGPAYLSAAVLYENLVVENASKPTSAPFPLVAVYPVEGTFWSDHPWSTLDAEWVGPDERDAADQLLAFLKQKPSQTRALALGFRPADPSIAISSPIDAAHGVDPKQPQTLLEVPDGATLEKLLAVWSELKKPANIVLVLDKSGSMKGRPLEEAKAGARAFLDVLHDRDEVSLVFFDDVVQPPLGPYPLKDGKTQLRAAIDGVFAGGGTSLYDAIASSYARCSENAKKEHGRIQAVVVMTDGADSGRGLPLATLEQQLGQTGEEDSPVHVFTIAFGEEAQEPVLKEIAKSARGTEAKGKVDDIVGVFRDMASFF